MSNEQKSRWSTLLWIELLLFEGGIFIIWIGDHYFGTTRQQIGGFGATLVGIGVMVLFAGFFRRRGR